MIITLNGFSADSGFFLVGSAVDADLYQTDDIFARCIAR